MIHHLITFSCYRRRPYLESAEARHVLLQALETMRVRFDFEVRGCVMPEPCASAGE